MGDPGVFLSNDYIDLDVESRVVVDIGAGAGESAMFFALRGASRVISFEPFPTTYAVATTNLLANALADRVHLVRCAVGRTEEVVQLDADATSGCSAARPFEGGIPTTVTTLERIVTDYAVRDGCLKVDCEGCEYDVILGSKAKVLRRFRQIVLEYHYGGRQLIQHLRCCGFNVVASRPKHHWGDPNPNFYVGLLRATRSEG